MTGFHLILFLEYQTIGINPKIVFVCGLVFKTIGNLIFM